MADTKLTELQSLTSSQSTDLLYIVSLQDAVSGESKNISIADLFGNVNVDVTFNNTVNANNFNCTALTSSTIATDSISTDEIVSLSGRFDSVIADFITPLVTSNLTASYSIDSGKVYNFDTSSSNLSVVLPSSLPNGFNIGITNIGTNTVYVSSTQSPILCALSNKCTTQFGSIFIYKSNDTLFGVGKFF